MMPTAAEPQEVSLGDLLHIVYRRKWIILGTVLLLTTLSVLIAFQLTPVYTANNLLIIERDRGGAVDSEVAYASVVLDSAAIDSQAKVLGSRSLVGRVIDQLGLVDDPEFNAALVEERSLPGLDEFLALFMSDPAEAQDVSLEPMVAPDVLPPVDAGRTRETVVDAFVEHLKVRREGQSHVIAIEFTSRDPVKSALISNTLADTYIADQISTRFEETHRATEWLGERLAELRKQVQRSEEAVESYREQNQLTGGEDAVDTGEQVSDLKRELISARVARNEREAKLRHVRSVLNRGEGFDAITEVAASPLIRELREQQAGVIRNEADLASRYGERHPKMISAHQERAELESRITSEVGRIVANFENELAVVKARERTIEEELTSLKGQSVVLNKAEIRLRELEREAQANRSLYETYLARFKEKADEETVRNSNARVISQATVPNRATFPRPRIFATIGLLASLVLGLLLIYVLECLDSGFRSGRRLEQDMGVPNLALVPKLGSFLSRGRAPQDYVADKPQSTYAEAIRGLLTSLLLSNVDRTPKVVLVTSSLPGEGKTVLATSLARLAAQEGQRVLLVDGDLRHPSVHNALGWTPPMGLVELMRDECTLDEVICADEMTDLHVLPIKGSPLFPTNLLGSVRMSQLMDELRQYYDLIIVDSAPLLAVTDSKLLAKLADKVLFVVRWEKTRREVAAHSFRMLLDTEADIAGSVLTQVDIRRHARYRYGDTAYSYARYRHYYVN